MFPTGAGQQAINHGRGSLARDLGVDASGASGDVMLQPLVMTRLAESRELTLEDYRGETVTLLSTISTTSTSGTDSWNSPPDQNFMITEIRGYLALTAQTTETLSILNLGNPSPHDRAYIKSNNVKLDLQLSSFTLKIFDNRPVVLASILPEVGGTPISYSDAPYPVPAGTQIQLSVSTYDQTAAIIGGSTDCGLIMSGFLVRVRR